MDVSGYTGIEFIEHGRSRDGIDCWGLVQLLYREQFRIELPDYTTGYARTGREDAAAIAALIEHGKADWHLVTEAEARPGDVVLLKLWNHPMHVGIVIAPGRMLHAIEGAGVCVGRLNDREWKDRKLGFYRHERLMVPLCPTS